MLSTLNSQSLYIIYDITRNDQDSKEPTSKKITTAVWNTNEEPEKKRISRDKKKQKQTTFFLFLLSLRTVFKAGCSCFLWFWKKNWGTLWNLILLKQNVSVDANDEIFMYVYAATTKVTWETWTTSLETIRTNAKPTIETTRKFWETANKSRNTRKSIKNLLSGGGFKLPPSEFRYDPTTTA